MRQLAQREVQQEREEEARQSAAQDTQAGPSGGSGQGAAAAAAAAAFLGQSSESSGAIERAAAAAVGQSFEHLVAQTRSAGQSSAISRALARGDATAAARTAAAATARPKIALGRASKDFGRTFARRAALAAPDSAQGAEGSVGLTSWKVASTSRKASHGMGNLAAAAQASEAREEAADARRVQDLKDSLAESKLLQAGGKGWEAMRVQAVEAGATMRLVGQLARRGKFGAICAMGSGAARRRMGPYATKFANTMRAEHTICSFLYPLAEETSVVTDPQVLPTRL